MPLLSELAWIWEGIKLLRRLAPVVERFVTGVQPGLRLEDGVSEADVRDQIAHAHAGLEARLNDLRKQEQEQNLKLNQVQEEIRGLQQQLEASLTLLRETSRQIATLWIWLRITASLLAAVLVFVLILLFRR